MPGKPITMNFMFNNFLLVIVGGGTGALLRYIISLVIKNPCSGFPLSTFLINIIGCFFIGILYTIIDSQNQNLKLMLVVGLLGGFTTFSSFGMETMELFNNGHVSTAIFYVILSNICGLAAVYLGIKSSVLLT